MFIYSGPDTSLLAFLHRRGKYEFVLVLRWVRLRCFNSSVPFTHQSFWRHLLLTETQDPPAASHRSRVWECFAYSDSQKNPEVPPHIRKCMVDGWMVSWLDFFMWRMDLFRESKFPSLHSPESRSRILPSGPSPTLPLSSKRRPFTTPSPFLWREECLRCLLWMNKVQELLL